MSQPSPNHNHTRGHGQGRPQGQALSDPTHAPQISLCKNQVRPLFDVRSSRAIQISQRYSDPFFYDTQGVPYWDDSNGAIHEIPSIQPKGPARTYTRRVGGKLDVQQQYNPYAEIVGEGPFGKNQARYMTSNARDIAPQPPSYQERARNIDFALYFDPEDTRNDEDLRGPMKESFSAAFDTKGTNKTVLQDVTNTRKAATQKRSAACTEDPFPATSIHETNVSSMPKSLSKSPMTPKKFRSKFENLISSRKPQKVAFEAIRTEAKQKTPFLATIEAPSSVKTSAVKQSGRQTLGRTPVLEEVLKVRAEEQAKALAKLEGRLLDSQPRDGHAPNILHRVIERASNPTKLQSNRMTSNEEKRQDATMIPGMDLSDSGIWTEPLYAKADPPPVPAKSTKRHIEPHKDSDNGTSAVRSATRDSTSSSVYSSGASTDYNEIARRTKAVANLQLFQDLVSPPTRRSSFQRHSAVPQGLDLSKIQAAKEHSTRNSKDEQRKRRVLPMDAQNQVEADIVEVERSEGSNVDDKGDDKRSAFAQPSEEDFETVESDSCEQISAPREVKMVQNGVKRHWYKSFRKV